MASQKRYRFGNGLLEMSFEYRTGELIEFIDLTTGENIIKSHTRLRGMPYRMMLEIGDRTVDAYPVRNMTLIDVPEWHARYRQEETESAHRLTITYPRVEADGQVYDIEVCVTIELPRGTDESFWRIAYACRDDRVIVNQVLFPALYGIYLGETWKDDVLYFPLWRGIRVPNPTEAMTQPGTIVGSRWMEYFQSVRVGALPGTKLDDGAWAYDAMYGGSASMAWMAVCDDSAGLYLISCDERFGATTLHAETFGPDGAGVGFHFAMPPQLVGNSRFESHLFQVGLCHGDWHRAADVYRAWRRSVPDPGPLRLPDWMARNSGLVAHYDFRDQCGDITHTYRDIPSLKDFLLEAGLNHVLFAGWDRGGFNVRMPQYTFDEELGTEEELAAGVKALRDAGIHVAFYINVQVVNREEAVNFPQLFAQGTANDRNGNPHIRIFSNKAFVDYSMCPMAATWREHLKSRVRYVTDVIGGDAVYFDCLSTGRTLESVCDDPNHGHLRSQYAEGFRLMLKELADEYRNADGSSRLCILGEGCSDAYAPYVCGHLITSFHVHEYAFLEMVRYTFPEIILMDMVYPFRRQSMRPSPVSYWWKDILHRAFLCACYFWIYDDEEYSSFRFDPDAFSYLRQVIALRDVWFGRFGRGEFLDDTPLVAVENTKAKAYRLKDSSLLVAVVPVDPEKHWRFEVAMEFEQAYLYDFNHTASPVCPDCKGNTVVSRTPGPAIVILPAQEADAKENQ